MLNDKLKETLNRIIELEPFVVNMDTYSSETDVDSEWFEEKVNECGTTFCIAGRLAHLDRYPEKYMSYAGGKSFLYSMYSEDLLGFNRHDEKELATLQGIWNWLFSNSWEDSLYQAKARAQYLLDNEKLPRERPQVENDGESFQTVRYLALNYPHYTGEVLEKYKDQFKAQYLSDKYN